MTLNRKVVTLEIVIMNKSIYSSLTFSLSLSLSRRLLSFFFSSLLLLSLLSLAIHVRTETDKVEPTDSIVGMPLCRTVANDSRGNDVSIFICSF